MKEILYIISSASIGGAELMAIKSAQFLIKNYPVNIKFICSGNPLAKRIKSLNFKTTIIPMRDNFDFLALLRLINYIKKNKPDLVHLHMNRAGLLGGIASKLLSVPSIITAAGMVKKIYVKYANLSLPCSIGVQNHLLSQGVSKKNMKLLKNCIDINEFTLYPNRFIKEDKFIITMVARLHPMKGHIDILKAIKILKNEFPNILLKVVGSGEKKYEKKLKLFSKKNSLNNFVKFLGEKDNIKEILKTSDIFVLPSYSEGLPLSILEAMACSLPVISYNIPGINEINSKNFSGPILVSKGNFTSLASRIAFLINNQEYSTKIGNENRKLVEENFTLPIYCKKLFKIYEKF